MTRHATVRSVRRAILIAFPLLHLFHPPSGLRVDHRVLSNPDLTPKPVSISMIGARLPFIRNDGQFDEPVAFYIRTSFGSSFVTDAGDLVYTMNRSAESREQEGFAFEEHLVGTVSLSPAGEDPSSIRFSSFVGNDTTRWKRAIPTFDRIGLGEIYSGIFLDLAARGNHVEKVFTIHPGADPGNIRIRISGPEKVSVSSEGELVLHSAAGSVSFSKPIAFQEVPGGRRDVEVAYEVDRYEYGFRLGEYDHRYPLMIDPLLSSTMLGGWCDDICYGPFIETDSEGNVYLSGFTCTTSFPTTLGAYQREYAGGQLDCFISKFSSDLSTLLASTLLGGSGFETECSIALDAEGNIYAGGFTDSRDFPTTIGAYDPDPNGNYDIFIAKLDNDLTTLIASTYIGGSDNDGFESNRIDLTVSDGGDLYFAAQSRSTDFPVTPNAFDTTFNGAGFIASGDAVVVRMNGDLSELLASTYLGGNQDELRVSIALDSHENVIVSTGTYSSDLETPEGAYDRDHGGSSDIFISKLSGDLSTQLASTYLGASSEEIPHVVRVDVSDRIICSGYTISPLFPTTPGAYDESHNGSGEDGFISILDNDLTALIASTFLGGSGHDRCQDLIVHEDGDIYVTGKTLSQNFPIIPGTYDDDYNGGTEHGDIFVSKLDGSLTRLEASTFLGGSDDDKPFGIAFDGSGNVFVGGFTHSSDYPTSDGAYDRSFGGIRDVVVSKLLLEPVAGIHDATRDPGAGIPVAIRLSQNVPNPFNPETTISFEIPGGTMPTTDHDPAGIEAGDGAGRHRTRLSIYDSRGRAVRTLVDDVLPPGRYDVTWNGRSETGERLPSGIYFCSLRCGNRIVTKKISLLK